MRQVKFFKMAASGNDFVVVDNRDRIVSDPAAFAREVCERHRGIGADGVLLLKDSKKADYQMQILNSDGSEAEACGNGFRCVALFAHERLGFSATQRFESLSGIIEGRVKGNRVRVRLQNPLGFKAKGELEVAGRKLHYSFLNTGVPHAVIFVEGIEKIPVAEIGREIRFHSHFKPAGTNVNFVQITGPAALRVRTYERGVEAETLACGTGSTASAIVAAKAGLVEPPVSVKTQGGEVLTIDFEKNGEEIRGVFLEGEAEFVFEGVYPIQK